MLATVFPLVSSFTCRSFLNVVVLLAEYVECCEVWDAVDDDGEVLNRLEFLIRTPSSSDPASFACSTSETSSTTERLSVTIGLGGVSLVISMALMKSSAILSIVDTSTKVDIAGDWRLQDLAIFLAEGNVNGRAGDALLL